MVTSTGSATTPAVPGYRERLTPSPAVWVATLPIAASSGLVVLTLLGGLWAALVAVVAMVAAVAVLLRGSAVIAVGDGVLRADPAHIPVHLLGAVRELDAEQKRLLRGPRSDARAFWCQRGWLRTGVAIEIADPGDPAPYWLLSSRHPDRLAAAIRSAKQAATARTAPDRTATERTGPLTADPSPSG